MQPFPIEAISSEPDTRLFARLHAKWLGGRVSEFVRRPAVANTLAALGLAVGALGAAVLVHETADAVRDLRESSATYEMYQEMMNSGPAVHNQLQNGTDVDYSQYVQ